MPQPLFSTHRHSVEAIFREAIEAVRPYPLLRQLMGKSQWKNHIGDSALGLGKQGALYLIAIGKAAGGMTQAFLELSHLRPDKGIIALPATLPVSLPASISIYRAGHPLPDQKSIAAGLAAHDMLTDCGRDDNLLALISGGGSALFELPIPGVQLEDLHRVNEMLLQSGLAINDMNVIRSALSQIKGGGLARMAYPARVTSLILSDVIGDSIGSVASGPTVLLPRRHQKARKLLIQQGLWEGLPKSVRGALQQAHPQQGQARRPVNLVVGGNGDLIDAASTSAKALGFDVKIISRQMRGEARAVGRKFAQQLVRRAEDIEHPTCLIMGGETTVTVREAGKGGRNQELALAGAGILAGHPKIVLASLASDGIDGPTDAAGGIVDGHTDAKIRAQGSDPERALAQNNSYAALKQAQALVLTGPTGTNVADLTLGLLFP